MELALSYFCFSNRCGAVARVKQIKLQHEIELPAGSWGIQMQASRGGEGLRVHLSIRYILGLVCSCCFFHNEQEEDEPKIQQTLNCFCHPLLPGQKKRKKNWENSCCKKSSTKCSIKIDIFMAFAFENCIRQVVAFYEEKELFSQPRSVH